MFRKFNDMPRFLSVLTASFYMRAFSLAIPFVLISCNSNLALPELPGEEEAHINFEESVPSEDIPDVVEPLPLLTEPQAQISPELYSAVAQNVPVRELLFAMARDASINIDVHPSITGQVSINAIDQTLPQILGRLARQVNLRWSYDTNDNLLVEPDAPYWHIYRVDYVNVERTSTTSVNVSNTIGTDGAAGNNSSATINQTTTNSFWTSLTSNLNALLNQEDGSSPSVVANVESGIININATSKQHKEIASFLNYVQNRSLQEVLIEATIVEVSLNDNYQSGVDWQALTRNSGKLNIAQNLLGGNLGQAPFAGFTLTNGSRVDPDPFDNDPSTVDEVAATVKLLSQFGDLRVLSSPKLMALNNQPAMLRVVDNIVYFSIEVEPGTATLNGNTNATTTTELHTVPVGFVMTITPQIGENDQITLNVRPTISRIVRYVNDPNPDLADAGVVNGVPEIQVREIESILKVFNGEIAILGGLMQDTLSTDTAGLPGASRIPGIRNLFSSRDDRTQKTELIIFIRPVIVNQPSLNGDFKRFQEFLPASADEFFNQNTFIQPLN